MKPVDDGIGRHGSMGNSGAAIAPRQARQVATARGDRHADRAHWQAQDAHPFPRVAAATGPHACRKCLRQRYRPAETRAPNPITNSRYTSGSALPSMSTVPFHSGEPPPCGAGALADEARNHVAQWTDQVVASISW